MTRDDGETGADGDSESDADPRGAALVRTNSEETEWEHVETGETVIGNELGDTETPGKYHLRWACPRCGTEFLGPDPNGNDDLEPAGWTSVHVPCSTDAELAEAREAEGNIAEIIGATPEGVGR